MKRAFLGLGIFLLVTTVRAEDEKKQNCFVVVTKKIIKDASSRERAFSFRADSRKHCAKVAEEQKENNEKGVVREILVRYEWTGEGSF